MQEERFSRRDCKLRIANCKIQIGAGGIGQSSPSAAFQFAICNRLLLLVLVASVAGLFASNSFAATGWFDDSFRRPIDVTWDADRASGSELCTVEFFTAGHHNPTGADIRVATDEGRQVPAKVLRVGPGDRISVVFTLVKSVKRYYVYFGNDKPLPDKAGFDDVKVESGLLLEMHEWNGAPLGDAKQVEEAWGKSTQLIGRTMIDSGFYGINPFGPQERTIAKVVGTLFAPAEGDYTFALTVDDVGALSIDGTRVVYAPLGPADARFQGKIRLKRGKHEFLLYHANTGGDGHFTVGWQRPDAHAFEAIPRTAFGVFARGNAGVLEELHKPLTADFGIAYAGECFFADAYSHRYKFAAREPKVASRAQFEWDFGDGQTGTQAEAEHVYLADGVYAVKLTVRIGANFDTQTVKLAVQRDWEHIDKPPGDEPIVQARVVGAYELGKIPEAWLPRATLLHERAGKMEWMLAAATRTASMTKHPAVEPAMTALAEATRSAIIKGQQTAALAVWEKVPAGSDLQPGAAKALAKLLLWNAGDFVGAAKALEPYASKGDESIRVLYADALVLGGKGAEGRKILESIPVNETPEKRVAKSGAAARTIEYYLKEKDWETGEEQWDNWQRQFPADFLEGYSVVLKTKLMEIKGAPLAAAKVAEAFATAEPGSSYSPQLLFRAGKLLEASDPGKSQALMKTLKDRYPEDPLSQ
ncbi:MAG: hypothetical protein JWP03_1689 [Phycisphaerales bacterium]|nr:hypothetical protein [Phycisphaerales bacterium]